MPDSKPIYRIYSEPQCIDPHLGTKESGRAVCWQFLFSDPSAQDLLQRLLDGLGPPWEVYADVGDDYKKHLRNEVKVLKANKNTGKEEWQWKRVGENHQRDCYDSRTEVLTRDGWKPFSQLTTLDHACTINMATKQIEYQVPTDLIAGPYDGPMIQIGGHRHSRIDLLVTPKHRMVICSHDEMNYGKAKLAIKKAYQLIAGDSIPLTAAWEGAACDQIRFPATTRMKKCDVDARLIAALLGWYVAEGYCNARRNHQRKDCVIRRVFIYQEPGRKRDKLRSLLRQLPWTFSEYKRGLLLSNTQAYNLVCDLGNKYTKRVPEWLKSAPIEVIRCFLETAVDGDGWRDGQSEVYSTVSKGLADDIQELWFKTGHAANIRERAPKSYCIRGRSGSNTVKQYYVHRKTRAYASLRDRNGKPNFKTVSYNGMIYCATVPNGTLVVRRNGKIAICGNCEKMSIVAACMAGILGEVHE